MSSRAHPAPSDVSNATPPDRVVAYDRVATATDTSDAARRIVALASRFRGARRAAERGSLGAVAASLGAPVRAAREALRAVRTHGRATEEHAGVSRLRQAAWLWWLNLRYDYGVLETYRFRLFSARHALARPLFLQWEEAHLLYRTVISRTSSEAAAILADKRRFAVWCADHGLPTPPILMEFEGGRVSRRGIPDGETPQTDLFAKWGTQYGGDATQRWRHEDGGWVDDAGRAWTFAEIVESLAERSQKGVVLLQPRLVNHPALRPLSPNALSTIRVMTTQRPGEPPRFLVAVLRMGTGASTADNFAQGGIASPIDAATGVIGEARSIDKKHRTFVYHTHPDTGAAITGFRVPGWEESVELAVAAHAKLGGIPCVGWDVAVLEDGRPVLLEGNWNPSIKLLQVATQTPLLATEFAGAYAAWLTNEVGDVSGRSLLAESRWKPV